ncbi:glutathione S-transferase family protein [Glacieibacterium megasporae]|uniref:glutathione S-transferase family protein n=1 Tax=Glacieibacterium megasporae TaxID=2835787 RepID=UPI001C1E58A9|nr:hypothetical protein [Polymorphobacter megasporae]UAJ10525.1 hypothetical protein KTC28_01805 [Polymorphobacter megasporae]
MSESLTEAVSKAVTALGQDGEVVPGKLHETPRYELFHAANSICSQKVRAVLAHHEFGYVSHKMNLFEGQTYLPDYVRLRMRGCNSLGGGLAEHHGGTTSTEASGCDGAVVPTIVDRASGEVMVDSKRTCLWLDAQGSEADRLYPSDLVDAIDVELAVVDNLPNYQMLMGRKPKGEDKAQSRTDTHAAFSRRKVAWCDRLISDNAGDDTLVRAYTAKRAKELSAADELFAPAAMRAAYRKAEVALHALEAKLAARTEQAWLLSNRQTMADLFWGIELLRMHDVGTASFWEGGRLPEVEKFAAAVETLPSIRSAIIEWPGSRF